MVVNIREKKNYYSYYCEVTIIIKNVIDKMIEKEESNDEFHQFGFCDKMFVTKDPLFIQFKEEIISKRENDFYEKKIYESIYRSLISDCEMNSKQLKVSSENKMAEYNYKRAKEEIEYLESGGIDEYSSYVFSGVKNFYASQPNYDFILENYLYYIILKIEFNNRKKELELGINNKELVEEIYRREGTNLREADRQFQKYALLSIMAEDLKFGTYDAYLFDSRIKGTLLINKLSPLITKMLIYYAEENFLSRIAVLPIGRSFERGEDRNSLLHEHLEFGNYFDFSKFRNVKATKLTSKNYDDSLWIIIDSGNMTFEELLDNFEVNDDDEVVTQVIHLEYEAVGEQITITHLDHEFIYYSFEEYEKRLQNYRQKGNASKRQKTIKIDGSRIPFIDNQGQSLLYNVLKSYIVNSELVDEYFQNVIS